MGISSRYGKETAEASRTFGNYSKRPVSDPHHHFCRRLTKRPRLVKQQSPPPDYRLSQPPLELSSDIACDNTLPLGAPAIAVKLPPGKNLLRPTTNTRFSFGRHSGADVTNSIFVVMSPAVERRTSSAPPPVSACSTSTNTGPEAPTSASNWVLIISANDTDVATSGVILTVKLTDDANPPLPIVTSAQQHQNLQIPHP